MGRSCKKTKKTTQTKEEELVDLQTSSFDLNILKGALLINTHGAEFRIVGFHFYANDPTNVYVGIREYNEEGELLEGVTGISWASLSEWRIQVQAGNN